MNRIEIKRGNTTIHVAESDLAYYEARGYTKVTTGTAKGRKTTAKPATDD